ncbi:MAG: NADH-quinone oxidoreductase subunit I [Candidatus Omnitrophica bacterium]|nr:NADH-quinone oxidoreductase subunit I [Candidatus Omnitrophota bacterium]
MIKTKIIHQPKQTLFERFYISGIIQGVWITTGHFVRNLTLHMLHRIGLFRNIPAAVTAQYPEEQKPLALRTRTRHRLTKREDGSPRCVACMMCETVCPARCIYIVAEEHPDPNIEKRPAKFDIDLGKCVYCGFCVEACPEDAIRMDTKIIDTAAYSRREMMLDINELLNPKQPIKA